MANFKYYEPSHIEPCVASCEGEVKLGQCFRWGLSEFAKYSIIGIPESIGVKMNNSGVRGTETLWPEFLQAFSNIQSTHSLRGNNISIVGHLEVTENTSITDIDNSVTDIVLEVLEADSIPIVIGGGHNNSFGIIRALSMFYNHKINAVNLDTHADFKKINGRHSGNGFSYAMAEGYLHKYAIVGLHRNYNAQYMLDTIFSNPDIHCSFYEDIFLDGELSFYKAIENASVFVKNSKFGIEVDLDCLEYGLSSAMTPCGLQSIDVRRFLLYTSRNTNLAYLHIAEGASALENGQSNMLMGKLVSYLVSDFLRLAD